MKKEEPARNCAGSFHLPAHSNASAIIGSDDVAGNGDQEFQDAAFHESGNGFHPVALDDTPDGRARNRRVDIVIPNPTRAEPSEE